MPQYTVLLYSVDVTSNNFTDNDQDKRVKKRCKSKVVYCELKHVIRQVSSRYGLSCYTAKFAIHDLREVIVYNEHEHGLT